MMSCMTQVIDLMTVAEFAEALRINTSTVRRWVSEDRIKAVRLPGSGHSTLRIPRAELERILATAEVAP